MPAIDSCHEQVVRALEKAGWQIIASPFTLETDLNAVYPDILARQTVEVDDHEIIVVEVKCFPGSLPQMTEFYTAIGQYVFYRDLIAKSEIRASVFLALPSRTYNELFKIIASSIVDSLQIKLIVVNLEREEIEKWLD